MSSFPIWNGPAPGALGDREEDIPTLTPFLATPNASGAPALLVLPGGGYGGLSSHEGQGYAEFFARHGISSFVLKYRLGSHGYRHPAMLNDAKRALRLLRARAAEFGIDPERIGVIGSSAGGHLGATLATLWDEGDAQAADPVERFSSRPALGILCYGVLSLGKWTHQGSLENLLGKTPDPALVEKLSPEKQVTERTPPCFLWHTVEDGPVPVENSLQFAAALQAKKVPFALHVYERGVHGIGLFNHPWAGQALRWLSLRWPVQLDG